MKCVCFGMYNLVYSCELYKTHTHKHTYKHLRTYVLDTFDTLYMKCGMLLNTLYVLCGVCRIYAVHVHVCARACMYAIYDPI
nr:hypothetical protein [Oryctes rhinoceros nudivirus]